MTLYTIAYMHSFAYTKTTNNIICHCNENENNPKFIYGTETTNNIILYKHIYTYSYMYMYIYVYTYLHD